MMTISVIPWAEPDGIGNIVNNSDFEDALDT